MRRKSSKNNKKSSPEKTKSETQRRSRRQSSRRRKRSSSRSSEESEEIRQESESSVQAEPSTPTIDATPESVLKASDQFKESLGENNKPEENLENTMENIPTTQERITLDNEENVEFQEGKQEIEDMEENSDKGKSKGKNNTNFQQSSNNIEPESENENVQGTHQSPSNDYADNENVVQNVTDSAKFSPETQDNYREEIVPENEDPQSVSVVNFESAYSAQVDKTSQDIENSEETRKPEKSTEKHSDTQISGEEKSSFKCKISEENCTSANKMDDKFKRRSPFQETEKSEYSESISTKKKITLRRSPPENKEVDKVVSADGSSSKNRSSIDENKKLEEIKPTKKVTLKRHTIDSSSTNDVQCETKNQSISRSLSEDVDRKRRLSSTVDDKDHISEDKTKKVLKQIKLIRTLSRDGQENNEERNKKIALRRKMWGRSDWLSKLTSSFYKIDVESIKIVCPTLEFLSESEVKLESTPREHRKSESEYKRKMSFDNKSEDSDRPDYEKQTSEESSGELKVEANPNIIAMNRRISIVDDMASKLKPPPSPPRNPPSDVLFITNLVRPFTVKQLKELLERTGKIKEEGFWTDRIKSKCYVQYESACEAEATRNALHGVNWPIGNGKKLVIDYATVEDLQKAKNPIPVVTAIPEKLTEKENREPDKDVKFRERDREERRKKDASVREWDLGKEDSRRRSRSKSKSRERMRKHSRRSYTPEGYNNNKRQRKGDDSVPQKLMDDLFLKTKATPSIYWQPLSPEEIETKQQQRLVRMEEHKRRIEETRGRGRDIRRIPFRRR